MPIPTMQRPGQLAASLWERPLAIFVAEIQSEALPGRRGTIADIRDVGRNKRSALRLLGRKASDVPTRPPRWLCL